MDDTVDPAAPTPPPAAPARSPLVTALKWIGIVMLGLIGLAVVLVLALNTGPGRRFVADRINGYTLASGLNLQVGRIDGSLYGAMVLRDVALRDPRGVFATSPELRLDWRPFAYLNNHVDVRSLTSPRVRIGRFPQLKETPSDPNAPLLPDLNIDVGRLAIDRIELGAAVAGRPAVARLVGDAHIADRRARINATAQTIAGRGLAGGDRLLLRLDAVPDADRLDIALDLRAPATGMVAGMAGLKAPLGFSIQGAGAWQRWQGVARGRYGGRPLIDLDIAARNGRFVVRGDAQPGVIAPGPAARLTEPRLAVALDATLGEERRVDGRLTLRSAALAANVQGLFDLGRSRFGGVRAEAQLLRPGAIAENLNGRAVRAELTLNGPFATPTVDYAVNAATVGFGETVVEQLAARGRATVDADRILIPVSARARRVSGLNQAAGGLLTNVAIDGDLAVNGTQILSDNLRIRSDRINATAIVVADVAAGRYAGGLNGRVNDYRIEGVGIVNIETQADLYTAPQGGFGIRGRVSARTARIFNDGAREFLGGNAYASARLGLDPEGIITIERVRLNAPQFRITSGDGRYDPAGPIRVRASGYSTQYGPLTAQVTGTLTRPLVLLRAPRPGLGVGLVDLTARVRGDGSAYAVTASGGTSYGPFTADVLVRTGAALAVDIRAARFAGMDINGQLRQLPAGPFAGQLRFVGSGVNGTARLAAAGAVQQVDVNATAANATIPGDAGITIGRALVTARLLLAETPTVLADAQIANARSGDFVLTRARGRINYRGGSGMAQFVAQGSSGVPFQLAANARLSPDQYLVALRGQGNGINFRTATPARIVAAADGYRMAPTRIDLDRGQVTLAGTYGDGLTVQSRLQGLDLALANAFVPNLGLGGLASGSVDFAQPADGSFPRADARLTIDDFRRSSLATVSQAVDIIFAGDLRPDGGQARALVKRGDATVGRMVATLRPLPPGAGAWTTRLLSAPLSGGVRYNGPAAVLFSLAGLADQQLSGPIAVAADFGGRVQAPQLNGIIRANSLVYENETYGTRLTQMRINGRFSSDRFDLVDLAATAGEGTVQARGTIGLSADRGFPIDLTTQLRNAQLARSDGLGATATGDLRIVNGPSGGQISGEVQIPEARYQIAFQGASEVPELTGVRRKRDVQRAAELAAAGVRPRPAAAPPGLFQLNIRLRADNRLYVSGMGLESEWLADLRIRGSSADPRVTGRAEAVRGTYSFAGRRFDLERGVIRFEGGALTDPRLDILATAEVNSTDGEDLTARIAITGSAQNPQVAFTAEPALPQDEVLSRLLFGSSVTNLSATQAIQLASALNSLRGGGGGLNPLGKLRSAVGIDRLRILGADEASGRGTALAAGQYLTDDIYIEVITDARGFTATQLEVALTRALSVLSQTGSFGGSSVNLRYSKDY